MADINRAVENEVADAAPYRARIAYQPALDGVRAIAVTMVLLFHGGVSWMNGGYFGVSVFFTLSGFLITSLLCSEFSSTQRVAPGAFYVRRAKRLLPASVVCLSVVSVMASANAWTLWPSWTSMAVCAQSSSSTPGTIGRPGKWPGNTGWSAAKGRGTTGISGSHGKVCGTQPGQA